MSRCTIALCTLLGLNSISVAAVPESELLVPDQALRPLARVSAGRCISATDACDPPTVNELSFRFPPSQALRQSDDLPFLLANHSKSLLDIAPSASAPEPIDPHLAFRVSLMGVPNDALHARFEIHQCCYLYREKFRFILTGHDGKPASKLRFGRYKLPPGEIKVDEFAGRTEVYHSGVNVILPIIGDTASSTFGVQITYQGCSEKGVIICYPPRTKNFKVVRNAGRFTVSESDNLK